MLLRCKTCQRTQERPYVWCWPAHRAISRRRSNSVAFGAKRTCWDVELRPTTTLMTPKRTIRPVDDQLSSAFISRETIMKIDGRCHCGYVTFEAEADPETTTICNCTDCQTMSGAPFRALIITRPGIDAISGIGPKRTCRRIRQMSALGVRADIKIGGLHIR